MSRMLLMGLVAGGVALVCWRDQPPREEAPVLVEVVGTVSGIAAVAPGSRVRHAVAAVGSIAAVRAEQPVHDGERIRVYPNGEVLIEQADPLLFGRRLDLNRADAQALMALPGVGAGKVRAVQAARPYARPMDVVRARGIGRTAARELAPLLHTVRAPQPEPAVLLNINTAEPSQLVALSGVGPVLAERIVESRDTAGAFADPSALQRVRGIGPVLAERLGGQVVFE